MMQRSSTRVMHWACLCCLMLVPCAGVTADLAAALEDAQQTLAAGDYDAAYTQYLHFAEQQRNPLAQFTVGMFHRNGWGKHTVDPVIACRWFAQSATGDIPAAAHFHADCLAQGIGGKADPKAAAEWYRKAADLGHYLSLCALAELHMTGSGVTRDPAKGLALCREAAERGATPARLQVGRYLLEGDTAIRDVAAAHDWFASVSELPEAQYYLGVMHRDGSGVTADALQALTWFESAASQGYVPAYFPTAQLYYAISPDLKQQPPSAEVLAKTYMWLSASMQSSTDPAQRQQAGEMLQAVLGIMPATWKSTLDARVTAHLARYPAPL